jgi:hypothetical protein
VTRCRSTRTRRTRGQRGGLRGWRGGLEAGEKALGRVLDPVSVSGDEGVPIREVAEIFAAHLNVPAVSVTPERAGEYVGFLGGFWGFDGPASAQITRDLLGWEPTRQGLIAGLKEGHYFA